MRGAASKDQDPAESLMREVGAQLRQLRLQRGEDLDDVAQHLRIKSGYLFALEQGDLSVMPGRTYALGFLRSYADYLGFDGADLVSRIKSTVENLTDRTSLRVRAPMPEHRLPKAPIVLMSLAVIAGIYAGWSYLNRSSRTVVDPVVEVPSELRGRPAEPPMAGEEAPAAEPGPAVRPADHSEAGPAADVAAGADPEPRAALPGLTDDAATLPASPEQPPASPGAPAVPGTGPSVAAGTPSTGTPAPDALSMQPAAGGARGGQVDQGALADPPGAEGERTQMPPHTERAVDQPQPSAAVTAPGPSARDALALAEPSAEGAQVYELGSADARVILRAREEAWVQVSSRTGDYTLTRTLAPGEALMVPNRTDLELWTGNATGLEILVDGTPVPALAGGGMVRRHVSLDPERLLQAARQPR
jgi:cytoskeletal protein RodZ